MNSTHASVIESEFCLASQIHSTAGLNSIAFALQIGGPLEVERLSLTLRRICEQEGALRVRFSQGPGGITRAVHHQEPLLEVQEAPVEEIERLVNQIRTSLSPEDLPWKALLLTHAAQDHTLLFVAHRCVWDERSTSLFASRLSALYSNRDEEQPEHHILDDEEAASERQAEGVRHFVAGLSDAPLEYGFPLRAPRPQLSAMEAAEIVTSWSEETSTLLSQSAAQWSIPVLIIKAAAASYVTAQYCRQQKLVVGLPFDTRPVVEASPRLGSFTACLPLGIEIRSETFNQLVARLAEQWRQAERFSGTPFAGIVRACGRRGATSAHALYQIAMVDEPMPRFELKGCTCRLRALLPPPQIVDLYARWGTGSLSLSFASPIIAEEIAAGWGESVSFFLSAALREPDRLLSELPLVSETIRHRLLLEWNPPETPAFLDQDLYSLLSRHCVPGNAKKALVGEGRSLSYAELAHQVDRLNHRLEAAQVGVGELVGICLPRTADMVVAMLATLKAGAGYVPLDPAFPSERLSTMAEHAKLKRILTNRELQARIGFAGIETITVDETTDPAPQPLQAKSVAPSAPAYVIYTSGSTGNPKGVAVPRAAVANFILSMGQRPGIGAEDTLCAVTTLSFDIAVLELLAPLAAGGTVVIATEAEARDPRLLTELLRTHGATILQATPVTWHMLCAADWPGNPKLKALCGGEPLPPSLIAALLPRVGELWNMYGPTETTVWSTCHRVTSAEVAVSVGTAIHNTRLYVLDEHLRPVPPGVEGRLFIGGAGVALGYLHDPGLTGARFLADPFVAQGRIYDTGDRARFDSAGLLYVLGRTDFQVKVRGFRIELGEIENQLSSFAAIEQVVCLARQDEPDNAELVAYYVLRPGTQEPSVSELRLHCGARLPAYMIPSHFVRIDALPRTPNGKVDRRALPKPTRGGEPQGTNRLPTAPKGQIERIVQEVWGEVLGIPSPSLNDRFFDLGGTSVLAIDVAIRLSQRLALEVPVLKVFEHPSISELARFIEGAKVDLSFVEDAKKRAQARRSQVLSSEHAFEVAVVGMAGRYPGARDLDQLWRNLCEGRETVTFFRREDLDPMVRQQDREDPHYIPARGVLEEADRFDAAFFGITPGEAELMDPQLRVFLEVAWEAFEHAGYVPDDIESPVGVWAGMGNNFYYLYNVLTRPDKLAVMGEIAAEIVNEKDHIAPRVSHRLNLRGPSLSVHTACSTGLVIVENAYQALVSHQVDMALAGSVDIRTPQKSGQRHEEGGIFSIDGHCRPYDAAASGTMFGDGVGAVVLKRLPDALADNDTIYAVIKGAAVNHDGARKVSYLAPSVEGHARLIASALALADVNPETITFVEGHGTATPIGDPIEVEALTRVYRAYTQKRHYCALGSIKGNFGHATTAAGIAGLLKVVLSLQHRQIPPTVHFKAPNPRIDFASSPFFVNNTLLDWQSSGTPRRAAVSSFGFCGTNAHVILEEASPSPASGPPSRPLHLILMSGRSREALDAVARAYAESLTDTNPTALADAAYTTQVGRKRFEHRRCAVLADGREAAAILTQPTGPRCASLHSQNQRPDVALMFPGQGAQYINMGIALYQAEPRFHATVDECSELLAPHLGCDLRCFLFPAAGDEETARQSLNNTYYTQPAIFTISYALAKQLMHWGIKPSVFIGHSIGEFVAATLSGVMPLPDALRLVSIRGQLMRDLPAGSMLSVRQPAEQLVDRLPPGIDLAASNGPQLSVVAGPTDLVARFSEQLTAEGITTKMLHTSHAFHSSMMDPIVQKFLETVATVPLAEPQIPMVSTVTGGPVEASALTDPHYWARHLRSPVHFSRAVQLLLGDERQVLVECGPRRTLATMALQHRPKRPERVVSTMPDSAETTDEHASLLLALGALWMNGCPIDWDKFHEGESRRRGPVPTYRFQRRRFWLEPGNTASFGIERAPTPPSSPELPAAEAMTSTASPGEDPLRRAVIDLIEQLQGRPLESPDDDAGFIALGLDSLLLTQFARAIRVQMGLEVTFRQLITSHSTLRLLVEALRVQRPSGRTASGEATSPESDSMPAAARGSAPLTEHEATPSQIEMWVCSQMDDQSSRAFNDSFSLFLKGDVNEDALVTALRMLPAMHESLRGHFSADGRSFVMVPQIDVTVAHHDFTNEPDARAAQLLDELIATEARTKYDLEHGPLFRATVVRKSRDEWVTILGAHRTVCDGWSLDVLLSELDRLYGALVENKTLPKGPQHAFHDFLAHRDSDQARAQRERARAHWKRTFDTLPPSAPLPFDGSRPRLRTFASHQVARTLGASVLGRARELSRTHNLSVFTVFFATLSLWLHKVSGARDFAMGVPIAAHPDCGMEDCVGPLANNVPVRCRFAPGLSFVDWCRQCHASLLDARENASIGLGEIVEELRPVRDPARSPLIAASFTHIQKYPPGKLGFAGTFVDYRLNPRAAEACELGFCIMESRESMEVSVHGNADLFSRLWVERCLEDLERLFETLWAVPEISIDTLELPNRALAAERWPRAETTDPLPAQGSQPTKQPHPDHLAKVAEIFAHALGLPSVDLTDDFFAKGGTPRAGVSVMREIKRDFGVDLPLGTLFESSSVQSLARAVASRGGELKSTMVELNRGSGTPVYFICGIALYLSLARRLRTTCYGIYVPAEESFLQSGGAEHGLTVPELANHYAETIRESNPEGPCTIAGVSFGGVLAFEVARQLRGRGRDISNLVLLDPLLPSGVRRNWPGWARGHIEGLLQKGVRNELDLLKNALRRRAPESQARQSEARQEKNALLWRALNGKATSNFLADLPTYEGRTLIVRAGNRSGWLGCEFAKDLGWSPFLKGPMTLVDSAGDHLGILEDERTAELIRSSL